jgi:hypothetical protein
LDLEEEKDVIGMLKIISNQTLEVDKELWACFVDWQKAFDRVTWTKLIQILKETVIDWRKRRLISKFYMNQNVKVQLHQGETISVKNGSGVWQGCCLWILLNFYGRNLTKKARRVERLHNRTSNSHCKVCWWFSATG